MEAWQWEGGDSSNLTYLFVQGESRLVNGGIADAYSVKRVDSFKLCCNWRHGSLDYSPHLHQKERVTYGWMGWERGGATYHVDGFASGSGKVNRIL